MMLPFVVVDDAAHVAAASIAFAAAIFARNAADAVVSAFVATIVADAAAAAELLCCCCRLLMLQLLCCCPRRTAVRWLRPVSRSQRGRQGTYGDRAAQRSRSGASCEGRGSWASLKRNLREELEGGEGNEDQRTWVVGVDCRETSAAVIEELRLFLLGALERKLKKDIQCGGFDVRALNSFTLITPNH